MVGAVEPKTFTEIISLSVKTSNFLYFQEFLLGL